MSAAESAITTRAARQRRRVAPGSLLAATAALSALELKSFFRDKRSLVFVLAFPVMLLVIFAALFRDTISGGGVTVPQKQLFMAGIIAVGVMSCAFQGLAINLVQERESGLIRRLARTPMPKAAYFLAKFVRVLVTSLLEVAILLTISVVGYGLPLPSSSAKWIDLVWLVLLGTAACSLMGTAFSALIPSAGSAAAMTTPIFMGLQFISGVFFPLSSLPGWMLSVGSLFPLRWLAQGLRSVFLPSQLAAAEPVHSWELGRIALVLLAWVVIGAVVTARTFHWRGPRVK